MTLRGSVSSALVGLGYERAGRSHVRPIDDDFSTVVDTGPLSGTDIAPWIGLHHRPTQLLKSRLLELPFDRFVGIVGSNVGIVLGTGYLRWPATASPSDVIEHINRGASRISAYAQTALLIDALSLPGLPQPTAFDVVPIYLQLGDHIGIRNRLAAAAVSECSSPGPVCDQFRRFEANVEEELRRT